MNRLLGQTLALAFVLAACAGPKSPSGWPSGEARPINVPVNAMKPE